MTRNDEIMILVAQGFTFGQVAGIMNISRNAVAGVVCRNRTTDPDPKKAVRSKPAEGFPSIVAAARWHGVDPGAIIPDYRIKVRATK